MTVIPPHSVGVTGWVGAASAHAIASRHPEYEWTVLLRDKAKEGDLREFLPEGTRFETGNFDSHETISAAASAADIVINWASSDYEPLTKSIIDGMKRKKSTCYLIHTSGAGILTHDITSRGAYGKTTSKIYDDWDNAGDLLTIPKEAPHRNVDSLILGLENEAPHIKPMIVCPPVIYGVSDVQTMRERSMARQFVSSVLNHGKSFAVGDGKSTANTIHIKDLASFFVKAVEAAAQGGGSATWGGAQSYYFVENGEVVWGEYAQAVGKYAFEKGLLSTPGVEYMSADEADKIDPIGRIAYGSSARSKAVRAYKTLGWKPEMPGLYEDTFNDWRFRAGEKHLFV